MNVQTAKTSELVAFYNEHCESFGKRVVKKFVDRPTAELRVTQLLADIEYVKELSDPADAYPVADQTKFHMIGAEAHCPKCGTTEVFAGRGDGTGVVIEEDTYFGCHACDWVHDAKKPAKPANPARGAAISESWKDPEVNAARRARHSITVDDVPYGSVAKAFLALGLPMSKHIKFRGDLVAFGEQTFGEHTFKLVK